MLIESGHEGGGRNLRGGNGQLPGGQAPKRVG